MRIYIPSLPHLPTLLVLDTHPAEPIAPTDWPTCVPATPSPATLLLSSLSFPFLSTRLNHSSYSRSALFAHRCAISSSIASQPQIRPCRSAPSSERSAQPTAQRPCEGHDEASKYLSTLGGRCGQTLLGEKLASGGKGRRWTRRWMRTWRRRGC
jgi:hypothetical protein